jgi:hypothetical protein
MHTQPEPADVWMSITASQYRIPMRARVVACLLQLATVDLTFRRYDTDGHRSDEHRAERKSALSVQRERRDCSARTTIPPRDLQR